MRTSWRSRNILQDDYSLANVGFDTAENEPSKVWYEGVTRCGYNAWIPHLELGR